MTLPGLNHYVKNREELLSLVIETFYDSEESNAPTTLGATINHCDKSDSATKECRNLPSALHETVCFNAKRP